MSWKFTLDLQDPKFYELTQEDLTKNWCGYKDGRALRCLLCGEFFKAGDKMAVLMTNQKKYSHLPGGNPLVCEECYDPHTIEFKLRQYLQNVETVKNLYWREFEEERNRPNPHAKGKKP